MKLTSLEQYLVDELCETDEDMNKLLKMFEFERLRMHYKRQPKVLFVGVDLYKELEKQNEK